MAQKYGSAEIGNPPATSHRQRGVHCGAIRQNLIEKTRGLRTILRVRLLINAKVPSLR
jgi:hypothetical protein